MFYYYKIVINIYKNNYKINFNILFYIIKMKL